MAAQVFGQGDPGEQVGLDGQSEKVRDLCLASSQHHTPASRKPDFFIDVLQGSEKLVSGHAAAGLVDAGEGEAGEGGTAAEHVARAALLAPSVDQPEVQHQTAEAVAGAASHGGL